jgi:glucose-1-phosphate thymidylyltransferase
MDDTHRDEYCVNCELHEDTQVQGPVSIGAGTKISPDTLIRGPVVIGENCEITASYIGPYTAIGDNVTIHHTEVEHSVVFDNASIDTTRRIVNSLIGVNAKLVDAQRTHPKTGHQLIIGDNSLVEL